MKRLNVGLVLRNHALITLNSNNQNDVMISAFLFIFFLVIGIWKYALNKLFLFLF